jgi:hypothetical protein
MNFSTFAMWILVVKVENFVIFLSTNGATTRRQFLLWFQGDIKSMPLYTQLYLAFSTSNSQAKTILKKNCVWTYHLLSILGNKNCAQLSIFCEIYPRGVWGVLGGGMLHIANLAPKPYPLASGSNSHNRYSQTNIGYGDIGADIARPICPYS